GMIAMGGERYEPLIDRYHVINDEIARFFPENRPVERDAFTIPLSEVGSQKSWSVGSKGAQLGEMRSKLLLPVPEGFAISAWAYTHFVETNDLQKRISGRIAAVNIKHYGDLVRISEEIRSMVASSEVPNDLAQSIRDQFAAVKRRDAATGFALRSSAVGEDTLFSFAGQYASFLNVQENEIVDRYRDVLANKFTPQAIYYYLSHSFTESDLAMGVCCIAMVDAVASGVIYTHDPLNPQDACTVVYAIYGLGKYLVDGTLTPDTYRVSKTTGQVVDKKIVNKPIRMVLGSASGTVEQSVPESEQRAPVLTDEQACRLAEFARAIEAHYGSPMDIEWAIDRDGHPFLLQARPLRVIEPRAPAVQPDVSNLSRLCAGGTTVCPGAASGPVFRLKTTEDLSRVPDGAVLVAPLPFPGLVTVMDKVGALVTHVGSTASHMATLAREFGIPTLVGVKDKCDFPEGNHVTVDATGRAIYDGDQPELVKARRTDFADLDDAGIYLLLKGILKRIAPLNLIHPDDANFQPQNCKTFHDITRFVHQMAMQEMFSLGKNIRRKDRVALHLKSGTPLKVLIIPIDESLTEHQGRRQVHEDDIGSVPMKAFWGGIKQEGWPSRGRSADEGRSSGILPSKLATKIGEGFSQSSFAVLSEEYMILSLRLGYHFTTVESMCTHTAGNNYIRYQCKGGGAALEKRKRRIRVFNDVLVSMGFDVTGKGDFIDARIAYQNHTDLAAALHLLGRLTMMTKQLDMALSNDSITRWYIKDFKKKLGIEEANGGI
ncbi:MAG: hypothetical protein JSW50_05445, partial [Candidatus Latescibacterota bacterium]